MVCIKPSFQTSANVFTSGTYGFRKATKCQNVTHFDKYSMTHCSIISASLYIQFVSQYMFKLHLGAISSIGTLNVTSLHRFLACPVLALI